LKLVEPDPFHRPSAFEALQHPWLRSSIRTPLQFNLGVGEGLELSHNFMRRLVAKCSSMSCSVEAPPKPIGESRGIDHSAGSLLLQLRISDEVQKRKESVDEKMSKMTMSVIPPGMKFSPRVEGDRA
jgi:serine/threonine protein kinase